MKMLNRLWNDEAGFIVSSELVLVATVLVLGMIVGISSVRNAVVQELADVAAAIGKVNQSYSFSAVTGHNSSTAGSQYVDVNDQCELTTNSGVAGTGEVCVSVVNPSNTGG
jgi:Flp pilus assembly pilin Flp